MSESIKNKAIRGVAWSAVEKFARQGLMVFFSILIARQLSPADYGLVAMLTIFLVVADLRGLRLRGSSDPETGSDGGGFLDHLLVQHRSGGGDLWRVVLTVSADRWVLWGAVTGGADSMDGLDLRDQLVPDGATGETEHRNGFPSAGVDLVSSHLGERRDGCLDGLSGIRGVDVGLAGLAAKPAQRGVTLGIGGLDALARVLPPLVPVFL